MAAKFLIADDEPHIRESIIRKMNLLGIKDVIEARGGEDAYQLIQNYLPDIVVTDIRMPGMDGIELIANVKQQIPKQIIFIILSGYDSFEYAQKAVSLGAFAYLLKPLNFKEMESILTKALGLLSAMQQEKEKDSAINLKVRQAMDLSRRYYICNLLKTEDPELDNVTSKLRKLDVVFQYNYFAVAFVHIEPLSESNSEISTEDMEIFRFILENILMEITSDLSFDILPFNYEDGQGFLFNLNGSDHSFLTVLKNQFEEVKTFTDQYFTITAGIGKIVNGIAKLNASYKTALGTLSQKMLRGSGGIYIYSDAETADKNNKIINFKTEQSFLEAMERRDKTAIINIIHGLYMDLTKDGFIDVGQLSNMNYQLILLFYKIIDYFQIDLATELEDEFTQYKQVNMKQGIHEIIDFFDKLTEDTFAIMEANQKSANSRLMDIIKNYILLNYDKDLSLNALSELVHLTPTYVGKLFKQEYDENLTDFILRARINKAKELMREGVYKSTEICEKIGFNDVKYFYKIFKKYTGLKPSDYKNKNVK